MKHYNINIENGQGGGETAVFTSGRGCNEGRIPTDSPVYIMADKMAAKHAENVRLVSSIWAAALYIQNGSYHEQAARDAWIDDEKRDGIAQVGGYVLFQDDELIGCECQRGRGSEKRPAAPKLEGKEQPLCAHVVAHLMVKKLAEIIVDETVERVEQEQDVVKEAGRQEWKYRNGSQARRRQEMFRYASDVWAGRRPKPVFENYDSRF